MQTDLAAVEAQIAEAGDIPKLLQEVRRKRIERVRAERAARREARARRAGAETARDDAAVAAQDAAVSGRGRLAGPGL